MKKYILVSVISLLSTLILFVAFINGGFDIIKKGAVKSFNEMLIDGLDKRREDDSWKITMPDHTSQLILKADDDNTVVSITLDITPFLETGLDVNKLPSYMNYNLDKKELYITSIYGNKKLNNESIAIDSMFNEIINTYRDKLSYHSVLGHFSLSLGNGNAFEYAKDMEHNDKDIVIVLNPIIFKNASVDIEKVNGFKYVDVTMDNGLIEKKLLKIFNIEEVNKCSIKNQDCS